MAKAVFFDLDGTLLDTGAGICQCARHTLEHFGIVPESQEALRVFVGPPLRDTFLRFGIEPSRIEQAVAEYRRYYSGASVQDAPYPGIGLALKTLRQQGFRLFVATSKPERLAKSVLEQHGLAEYFEAICGDTLDGSRNSKALVIQHLLDTIGGAKDAVMVGDTVFDVLGAKAHGIDTIAVEWGYGTVGELRAAGACAVVRTPRELLEELGAEPFC